MVRFGSALVAVSILSALFGAPIRVDEAKTPDTETVRRLVRQLSSEDFNEREEAGKSLVAIGYPALDALLKAADTSDDAEVRRQARKLVEVVAPRYPERCCFRGHTKGIHGVAISPDGKQVASASDDCTLRVWDLQTGKEVRCLKYDSESGSIIFMAVVFSPDGKRALSNGLVLWNTANWTEVRRFKGHSHAVFKVAFSADGCRAVSGCGGGTVCVWNLKTGEQIHCLTGHKDVIYGVGFSRNGTKVLTGCYSGIRVWDVATGEELRRIEDEKNGFSLVAFNPAGDRALTADGRTLTLWDLKSGVSLRTFQIKAEGKTANRDFQIVSVAFSPDGKRALSGSADRTLRLWNVETGEPLRCMDAQAQVYSLAFSADGTRALTGALDNTVRLWDLPR